jgi:type III pantothenate kinase
VLLALDVGNTNVHYGVFRGERLAARGDFANDRARTADELGELLAGLLREGGVDPGAIRDAVVGSVVPAVTGTVAAAVRAACALAPLVLASGADAGIPVRYDDPRELGIDRLANAVAGFARHGGPLVVVDLGTATTVDAVAGDGTFLGGAIAPGLGIAIEALARRAPRLPPVELARPAAAIGTTTAACLQSGVVLGYAGLVGALVDRVAREVGGAPAVVVTGGLAGLVARAAGLAGAVEPDLTLEGLRLICLARRRGVLDSPGPRT